jgi:hypothetical protein
MGETHKIGTSPWTREDYLGALEEFAEVYKNRPVKNNAGGMKAPQLFYAWFVAKELQPAEIIESGVWYGQGTWMLEQAAPKAQIHCIDPVDHYYNSEEGYKSPTAHYYSKDFLEIDWSHIDRANTLCFFDDHQDVVPRIMRCTQLGLKKIMFEDNYPPGQGDCLSMKQALHKTERREILPGLSVTDYLSHLVQTYLEFPPVSEVPTNRWGQPWDHYDIEASLLGMGEDLEESQKIYLEEADNYTWINYVELAAAPSLMS